MLALSLGLSCEGCPGDAPGFLPVNFGTLNPLFDRAAIVGLPGRVVDPRRHVPKQFRIDFILPVERSSIGADSVVAFVVPSSSGRVASFPEAPAYFGDLPGTPLTRVRVTRLDPVLSSGRAVGLIASLDARDIEAAAGAEIVIQVDPRAWNVLATTSDDVFRSPMRFTYRVSERPPDNDPPFVADVTGFATGPLDALLDVGAAAGGDELIVAPHAALRFVFSEPLASAAPVLDPQDPVGLQLRPETFERGGFTDLVTRATAGMVPGREHCISFVPPAMADIGPLSWGTQDLTGEPIVPALRTLGLRRAARRLKGAPDFCFRTGAVRIESPRRGALVAAANGLPPIRFIDASNCDDGGCDGESWRISIREDDGNEEEVGVGWVELGTFRPGDPSVDIDETNGLRQGEVLQPVRSVEIVPLGGPVMLPLGLCLLTPDACPAEIRIDRCLAGTCTLGDIIPVDLDVLHAGEVDAGDVTVDDTDRNDGVIERICVVVDDPTDTLMFGVADGDGNHAQIEVPPTDPRVHDERLPDGRIRRCVTDIAPLDGTVGDGAVVSIVRRDASGNVGIFGTEVPLPCRSPPRKHVGYDGRRSALALDVSGTPHAIYADGEILYYARWDGGTDTWQYEQVHARCPFGASGCVGGYGWQVDIAINASGEPVICYSDDTRVPGTTLVPGWELDSAARVIVAVRDRATGTFRSVEAATDAANTGCAIEARRSRPTGTIADYLVAYSVPIPGSATGARLRYVSDDGATLRLAAGTPVGALPAPFDTFGDGTTDIAVDDNDAFWVVLPCRPSGSRLCVLGELPASDAETPHPILGPAFAGRVIPIADHPSFAVQFGLNRPRVAARRDGEVAVVMSDGYNRLRYAHRTTEPFDTPIATGLVVPSFRTEARAFNLSDAEPPKNEQFSDNTLNNGGVASAAGIGFQGIPASVAFSREEARPLFAWHAARPDGIDYEVILLARPDQIPGRWDFEVIDGRVALSANVQLMTGPTGRVRIGYHNGLGNRDSPRGGSPRGSLLYFREEDEDEIFRLPTRLERGDERCFASVLYRQDQPGVRGPRAGLDDDAAALVPRPSVDFDPCGRTIDPGFADAIEEQLLRDSAPLGTPTLSFDQLPNRFARMTTSESDAEFRRRTNLYRLEAFGRLRSAIGDLAVLDFGPFARSDGVSWNRVDPTPGADVLAADELLAAGSRGGRLDSVFLMLDELLDDLCGRPLNTPRRACSGGTESESIVTDPLTEACTGGVFERNANGYFRGIFYRDPITLLSTNGDRDFAAAVSYRDTFSPEPLSDDVSAAFEPPAQTGLIAAALRGMRFTSNGPSRAGDHHCVPIDDDCVGVGALSFAAAYDGLRLRATDAEATQSAAGCPTVRTGAQGRFPSFDLTSVQPGSGFGCCPGYVPRACDADADCADLSVSYETGGPIGPVETTTVAARCQPPPAGSAADVRGYCERPPACPDGHDRGSNCPTAACPDGSLCLYTPICHPSTCAACEAFYCDDTLPNPPPIPNLDSNAPPGTDSTVDGVAAALAFARNTACGPGSRCEDGTRTVPACFLRQLLGHYVVRALPGAATGGLGDAAASLQGVTNALSGAVIPDIFFDERVADTHVRWVEHRDFQLPLQGYLEITIRLEDPAITVDAVNALLQFDVEILDVEPTQFRFRLQPYFHAIAPSPGVCDSCGRRRPDETIHWAVADARLIRDYQPGVDPPTDSAPGVDGCSLGCIDVAHCYLRNCDTPHAAGIPVDEPRDVTTVFDTQLATAFSSSALRSLDSLTWSLLADPLAGGIFMGRAEAVDELFDAPVCQPAAPPITPPPVPPQPNPLPLPIVPNAACTQGQTGHAQIQIADTIEHLRVRVGVAEVFARENQ